MDRVGGPRAADHREDRGVRRGASSSHAVPRPLGVRRAARAGPVARARPAGSARNPSGRRGPVRGSGAARAARAPSRDCRPRRGRGGADDGRAAGRRDVRHAGPVARRRRAGGYHRVARARASARDLGDAGSAAPRTTLGAGPEPSGVPRPRPAAAARAAGAGGARSSQPARRPRPRAGAPAGAPHEGGGGVGPGGRDCRGARQREVTPPLRAAPVAAGPADRVRRGPLSGLREPDALLSADRAPAGPLPCDGDRFAGGGRRPAGPSTPGPRDGARARDAVLARAAWASPP